MFPQRVPIQTGRSADERISASGPAGTLTSDAVIDLLFGNLRLAALLLREEANEDEASGELSQAREPTEAASFV